MCQVSEKYDVLKCVKNHACELIGVFDNRDDAEKARAEKENEITDENIIFVVVPPRHLL
ncbi:MAG: hypothetical protein GWN94_22040 [Phycisphaerae bacterium]|nr:hypothetical protein [Phycisphaerae bacterium]